MHRLIFAHLFLVCFFIQPLAQKDTLSIYFPVNKAVPKPDSENALRQLVNVWNETMELNAIVGHTDSTGSTAYNFRLSEQRIAYVRAAFASKIGNNRVDVVPMGEQLSHNATEGGSEKYRRVDVIYTRRIEVPEVVEIREERIAHKPLKKKELTMEEQLNEFVSSEQKSENLNIDLHIHFYGGEATILPESGDQMNELLRVLKEHPDLCIRIHGHVCCGPDPELALARAKAVYHFLRDNKIAADRMEYLGHSNLRPKVYPEKNELDRIANRRVTIEFYK